MTRLKWFKITLFILSFAGMQPRAFSRAMTSNEARAYKRIIRQGVQDLFHTDVDVQARIYGRPRKGVFEKLDVEFQPFKFQQLQFSRGELAFTRLAADARALARLKLRVTHPGEVESNLAFTLSSLQSKLAGWLGPDTRVKADVNSQTLVIEGRGRFLGVGMPFTLRAGLRFDGQSLWLETQELRWGRRSVPAWAHWMGSKAMPDKPVLILPNGWVKWNIQEVHLSNEMISLSTNW